MKLRQAAIISYLACTSAFSVVPRVATTTTRAASFALFSAVANDFESAVLDGVSIYNQLGIEEGKLALGVKPDEVLKYIGT
jgi:hypothetical protein